jgi:hypothetical protein
MKCVRTTLFAAELLVASYISNEGTQLGGIVTMPAKNRKAARAFGLSFL